jgi:hypothetical protein
MPKAHTNRDPDSNRLPTCPGNGNASKSVIFGAEVITVLLLLDGPLPEVIEQSQPLMALCMTRPW